MNTWGFIRQLLMHKTRKGVGKSDIMGVEVVRNKIGAVM